MTDLVFMGLWALWMDVAAISGWVSLFTVGWRRRGFHDPLAMVLMCSLFGPILTWSVVVGVLRGGQ